MPNNKNNNNKRWTILSGIAIQMGVIIYLFTKVGVWLDLNYSLSGKKYTISLTLAGVAISFFLVLRQTNQLNK
jgi:uncharacterized membrane protein YiaA